MVFRSKSAFDKEFVLADKRTELVQTLRNEFGIHNSKAWLIVKKVVEQDKEFIEQLKKYRWVGLVNGREVETISISIKELDNLTGDLNG